MCARQTGFGAKKKAGKKQKAGHKPGKAGKGKPAKKAKNDDMQAMIIQAAFKKYKVSKDSFRNLLYVCVCVCVCVLVLHDGVSPLTFMVRLYYTARCMVAYTPFSIFF